MSNHEKNRYCSVLPKPVSLTPEEVRQVAAGTAANLPAELSAGIPRGRRRYPPPYRRPPFII